MTYKPAAELVIAGLMASDREPGGNGSPPRFINGASLLAAYNGDCLVYAGGVGCQAATGIVCRN
jgi:hypothetical protein